MFLFYLANLYILTRYEEVEVRKKLEEKERQEEKKRREEITERDGERGSPKASSINKKDGKKVEMPNNKFTFMLSAFSNIFT